MGRNLKVAAAQVGAVHRWSPRAETLNRLIKLLEEAAQKGAQLVVYPETTLTTFFPRYLISDETELDGYYEEGDDITSDTNVVKLFNRARELEVDISIGYAEKTKDGHKFNTCIYYSGSLGKVIQKYRKSHLPGTVEPFEDLNACQQLEKRYFEEGDTGFEAFRVPNLLSDALKKSIATTKESADGQGDPIIGMLICNDRRWPEAWRVYGLQGIELLLCGYNSTAWAPQLWGFNGGDGGHVLTKEQARDDAYFHHKLVMTSNSYMNSCFSVCAARAGLDDNEFHLIGGSCIVSPLGKVLAEAQTEGDEVVVADIDLTICRPGKETTFNFSKHRRTELYKMIVEQKGVVEPELLD